MGRGAALLSRGTNEQMIRAAHDTVEITPKMIEAGAEIIRSDRYDLTARELARQVFEAMASAQASRRRPYAGSQRRRVHARASATRV